MKPLIPVLTFYLLCCSLSSFSQNSNSSKEEIDRTYYVITFKPGPNWEYGKPMSKQKLSRHRDYYQSLIETGKVVIGGGFIGTREGMSILNVASKEAAESICRNDPAIKTGVFSYEIRTMFAVFRGLNNRQLDLSNLTINSSNNEE